MATPTLKKAREYEKNKLPQEQVQPDKDFNTISVPIREMIMPKEFNTVSDPEPYNQAHTQTTDTAIFSIN